MIGFNDMFGLQQLQRDVGVPYPAGGVDSRSHAEGDVGRSEFRPDLGALDQGAHSGPQLFAKRLNAELDHNAVFAEQRHNIRNGSERHIVKHLLETGLKAAEVVFASIFNKGVRKLECGPCAGEHLKIFEFRIHLGIDDRESLRQFRTGLVVVGDDHIDSARDGVIDRIAAGDSAIDGHEHPAASVGIEGFLQRLRRETVPVIEAMRDKRMHDCAVLAEHQGEQSAGGDAVGIVIPVNEDWFTTGDRVPQTLRGLPDSREAVGIAQLREAGRQKILNLIFTDSASGEVDGDRPWQRELPLYRFDLMFQIIPGKFPIFYTHLHFPL